MTKSFRLIAAAAIAAVHLSAASAARADLITYDLSVALYWEPAPLYTENLYTTGSGSFIYDTSDHGYSNIDITLHNLDGTWHLTTSAGPAWETNHSEAFGVDPNSGAPNLYIFLNSPLDLGGTLPISYASAELNSMYDNTVQFAGGSLTEVSRVVPTPAPEPASLTLLGSGLIGFAALRRRRKIAPAI